MKNSMVLIWEEHEEHVLMFFQINNETQPFFKLLNLIRFNFL